MKDLWSYLQTSHAPVVLWGMGDGADKIINVCQEKGIEIHDFFASDGFVRGQFFHGKQVLSYTAVRQKYGDGQFTVLLAFGSSRPEVLDNIKRVAGENTLFVPDVPVCAESPIFDAEFYTLHANEINDARAMFADDESRRIFDCIINAKLTGNLCDYLAASSNPFLPFSEILHPQNYHCTIDFGAYVGDTVKELAQYAPNLAIVTAVEPDSRTYKKLVTLADETTSFTVSPVHAAAWSQQTELSFGAAGGRGASLSCSKRQETIPTVTGDLLSQNMTVDYIKFDVEGAEKEALIGCSETIRTQKPELLVSLYHRSEDIFVLPRLVYTLCPEYRLFLRRPVGLPAWDINLYAVL